MTTAKGSQRRQLRSMLVVGISTALALSGIALGASPASATTPTTNPSPTTSGPTRMIFGGPTSMLYSDTAGTDITVTAESGDAYPTVVVDSSSAGCTATLANQVQHTNGTTVTYTIKSLTTSLAAPAGNGSCLLDASLPDGSTASENFWINFPPTGPSVITFSGDSSVQVGVPAMVHVATSSGATPTVFVDPYSINSCSVIPAGAGNFKITGIPNATYPGCILIAGLPDGSSSFDFLALLPASTGPTPITFSGPSTLDYSNSGGMAVTATAGSGTTAPTVSVASGSVIFINTGQCAVTPGTSAGEATTVQLTATSSQPPVGPIGYCVLQATLPDGSVAYDAVLLTQAEDAPVWENPTPAASYITKTSTTSDAIMALSSVQGQLIPYPAIYTSLDPSVCTVGGTASIFTGTFGGTAVTYLGPGTCQFRATSFSFLGLLGSSTTDSPAWTVVETTPMLTFSLPSSGLVGDKITLSATSDQPLDPGAITYSVLPADASNCSITSATTHGTTTYTLSLDAVGSCQVKATQAASGNIYTQATTTSSALTISPAGAAQTITFTSPADGSTVATGDSGTLAATASSGLAVTFTIDSSSTATCSISGNQVTYASAGSCVIDANQAGVRGTWAPATQVQHTVTVKKAQTITFANPGNGVAPGSTTLSATASSGLPVTFSVDGTSTQGVCSISGTTLSYTGVGSCVIDANQAGDGTYAAAPTVQQTVNMKLSQVITFTSPANGSTASALTHTVISASAPAGAITYSIDKSSTAGACVLDSSVPNQVDYLAAGTCVIDADQPGDATYVAAPQVQSAVTVVPALDAVTFTAPAPGIVGTSAPLTAHDLSGNPLVLASTTPSVCAVHAGIVQYLTKGQCGLKASVTDDGQIWSGNPVVTHVVAVYARPVITTAKVIHGTVGRKLTIPLTYVGGVPGQKPHWSVASGSAPAGFRIVGDPVLTGTPTKVGTYRFVLSLNGLAKQHETLIISPAARPNVPGLPDTGGPDIWWLWLAGGLVTLGGLVVLRRREA